jgi:hypothetical protein
MYKNKKRRGRKNKNHAAYAAVDRHLFAVAFNTPPLWGVKLGVRGICSPVYAKISR